VHFLPISTSKKIAVLFYFAGAGLLAGEAIAVAPFGSSSYAVVQPKTSTMIRAKFLSPKRGGMQQCNSERRAGFLPDGRAVSEACPVFQL
jgi:hypothetical protein